MQKDPAWVCRTLQKIESDFSVIYQRPAEKQLVDDHLARIESVYSKALKVAEEGEGMAQVAALRTVNSILRERMQFLQYVGLIGKDQESAEADALRPGFRFRF